MQYVSRFEGGDFLIFYLYKKWKCLYPFSYSFHGGIIWRTRSCATFTFVKNVKFKGDLE